jgi:hypothetical protein
MRRLLIIVAAAAVVVLGTATPAVAKGPDRATITGPELAEPIVVAGGGEPGMAGHLSDLAQKSGLFPAMFGTSGAMPLLAHQPAGRLGPKYALVYRVPAGDDTRSVRQDLYPSAAGGPLTYTPAGQTVFGGSSVTSGWFRGEDGLGALLARLGVPGASGTPADTAISSSSGPGGAASASPGPSLVPRAAGVPASHRLAPALLAGAAVAVIAVVASLLRARRSASRRSGKPVSR